MKAAENFEIEHPVESPEQVQLEETTDASEPIDTSELKAPLEKRFIKSLTEFGNFNDLQGSAREDNLKLHPYSHPKGGFIMLDEEKVIPKSIKEMSKKVLGSLIKGQIHDITKNPAPAYLHHPISALAMCKNDMTQCGILKQAAKTSDPIERMKLVIKYYVATQFYNSTLL